MDIKSEIFALLESLDCDYEEDDGLVVVTPSDGSRWIFTTPRQTGAEIISPDN